MYVYMYDNEPKGLKLINNKIQYKNPFNMVTTCLEDDAGTPLERHQCKSEFSLSLKIDKSGYT